MLFRSPRAARIVLLVLAFHASWCLSRLSAQYPPAQPDASAILHRMQKLNVLGSVLYIVAHPDDENTRLITWLANGKKMRTGNLSLTRGDGGQNLIGPELGDALGIIRTQELLAARRIDGGEQFFTRAVDFGYSKSAAESFGKWGKEDVLSDVVRVIRMFKPDIIITRFAPDRSAGHGHHEASAILAEEAFDRAGDPTAFPEQLTQGLQVWKPRRLFFNGSTWWKKDLAVIARTDPDWYTVDVGGYDPLLGASYTEIAGRSRSMHKSQGFGAAETRGEMLEYLKLIKGDKPTNGDIFQGIDMTWGKVGSSGGVQLLVDSLVSNYLPTRPDQSAPLLSDLHRALAAMDKKGDPQNWLPVKQRSVEDLLFACHGLMIEALCDEENVITGSSYTFELAATNRSGTGPILILPDGAERALLVNHTFSQQITATAPKEPDSPFWLKLPHNTMYTIADPGLIGLPDMPGQLTFACNVRFGDGPVVPVQVPVQHRWVDRVQGEQTRACAVVPPASIHAGRTIVLMPSDSTTVPIGVDIYADSLHMNITCARPDGWKVEPMQQPVQGKKNERIGASVAVYRTSGTEKADVDLSAFWSGGRIERTQRTIAYDHIPVQHYSTPAFFRAIPLSLKVDAQRIGYLQGAGDDVPKALEQMGLLVDMIDPRTSDADELRKYDAIVTGIRAYNTVKEMKDLNPVLMRYVEEGGTLVCQYNTRSSDMVLPDSLFGPYPFKLTRDRVTVEEAPPTFLAMDHPLLNTPNRITAADFDGWVQERGLYFCGNLDPHYTPLIAWNDPGEKPLNGALITCDHGKGRYVYTGISFFRQLPAGVPGAYRLFANLISPRNR
ncbi:MAG TPA: PIG-L family deacetylase [Flavobacteriales bacterium]|nr:PIG-L family deacetylase [Flavobacteriales bacterium]HNI04381.1 PIG-L family deacetylase [Flavobacteriales bacterium]HNK67814.1 PIG-L family deacetylase [Flavobacteriales bacterium]HNM70852.1 PIG-L family deacetylase [Flavobacteriales bacterium]